MSTCVDYSAAALNSTTEATHQETLTLTYGAYKNWGRWNHNTTRIAEILEYLRQEGYGVQLKHDDTEDASKVPEGFVVVTDNNGNELFRLDNYQQNPHYRYKQQKADNFIKVFTENVNNRAQNVAN